MECHWSNHQHEARKTKRARARAHVDGAVEKKCWNKASSKAADSERWCNGSPISSKHSQSGLEAKLGEGSHNRVRMRGGTQFLTKHILNQCLGVSEHWKPERQQGCGRKHSLIPPWTPWNGFQSFSDGSIKTRGSIAVSPMDIGKFRKSKTWSEEGGLQMRIAHVT